MLTAASLASAGFWNLMIHRASRTALAFLASGALLAVAGFVPARASDAEDLLRFGARMARNGSWREARYRWEKAAALEPDDPRILNNLAVAAEVLGEPAAAVEMYVEASRLSEGNESIEENLARAERSLARGGPPGPVASPAAREEAPEPTRKLSKTVKVPVRLPVPPRIDLTGMRTALVASFVVRDAGLLDVSRETVRFLRGELRKHTSLQVLDVTPIPPVPEQTVDDLAANAEFWKRLAREYGADLLLSGEALFVKRDASGFQDVDMISSVTGQKVRQTRFVEREQFELQMDLVFVEGAAGQVLLRDRLRRSAVFTGTANDPITAFYDLAEAARSDVVGVVAEGIREETRAIFKK